jgi:hypothetical protein
MGLKMEDISSSLRKLAKKNYWQNLYAHAKDLNIQLFDNDKDLTDIQVKFLNLLRINFSSKKR